MAAAPKPEGRNKRAEQRAATVKLILDTSEDLFAQVQPLCHADEGTEVNGQRVHWPVSLSVVPLVRTTLGQSIASPRFARNERR